MDYNGTNEIPNEHIAYASNIESRRNHLKFLWLEIAHNIAQAKEEFGAESKIYAKLLDDVDIETETADDLIRFSKLQGVRKQMEGISGCSYNDSKISVNLVLMD